MVDQKLPSRTPWRQIQVPLARPSKDVQASVSEGLGSYRYGESVLSDLPPGACQVLEIRPHSGATIAKVMPTGADIQDAF
ncbi:MAG: hypothetical protein ACE15E_24230 [Acidobacteriota bacterium]